MSVGVQDPSQHGIRSRETGAVPLIESWAMADEANKERTDGEEWEWIPVMAIEVKEEILPRERGEDKATIDHYMLKLDELPPILVQADSLTLVGGLNRLRAHERGARRIVKAFVENIPEEELWAMAFKDNDLHGLPMTATERRKAGQRYMRENQDMTDREIANWAGVAVSTVSAWRAPDRRTSAQEDAEAKEAAEREAAAAQGEKEKPPARSSRKPAAIIEEPASGQTAPPPPRPPTPPGPTPRPQSETTMGQMLDDLLQRSPVDTAEEMPDEMVGAARDHAKKAAMWFARLAEALADREAEIGARGNGKAALVEAAV